MNKNITTFKSMLLVTFILIAIFFSIIFAQNSSNYRIQQAVIAEAGNTSNSSKHKANDVIGQPSPVGKAISTNYIISSGFFGDGNRITSVAYLEKTEIPASFKLYQNYPNPFNPATTIEFTLPKSAFVTLKVYNLLGEEVATLIAEQRAAGIHKFNWKTRGLASGAYLYRLEAGSFVQVKKLILMR